MNFQYFFFAANFIGPKTLNVMPRISQSSKSSPSQTVCQGVANRLNLMDLVIVYARFES